jgi:hypothetical protein
MHTLQSRSQLSGTPRLEVLLVLLAGLDVAIIIYFHITIIALEHTATLTAVLIGPLLPATLMSD